MSLKVKKMNISNAKKATVSEVKQCFDDKIFEKKDVVNILLDTTKEDELFDYVEVEKEYVRINRSELDSESKEKDDFELSR